MVCGTFPPRVGAGVGVGARAGWGLRLHVSELSQRLEQASPHSLAQTPPLDPLCVSVFHFLNSSYQRLRAVEITPRLPALSLRNFSRIKGWVSANLQKTVD